MRERGAEREREREGGGEERGNRQTREARD